MSFSFNSQINKEKDTTEYSIQITTNSKEQYLFMQEMARQCIDGQHIEKQGDTGIFTEPYGGSSLDWKIFYPLNTPAPDATLQCDIPNCCKACPTHPSNGGSGICNCTAPYLEQGFNTTVSCSVKEGGN